MNQLCQMLIWPSYSPYRYLTLVMLASIVCYLQSLLSTCSKVYPRIILDSFPAPTSGQQSSTSGHPENLYFPSPSISLRFESADSKKADLEGLLYQRQVHLLLNLHRQPFGWFDWHFLSSIMLKYSSQPCLLFLELLVSEKLLASILARMGWHFLLLMSFQLISGWSVFEVA